MAIAVLRQDGEAYAFSAESYAYDEWRKPEWLLPRGQYEVTIQVEAAGGTVQTRFRLDHLSGRFDEFNLRSFDT